MSQKFHKLLATLRELFLFDRADLDFGLYRIMNARREEIEEFLKERLLPSVREHLGSVKAEELKQLEKLVQDAIQMTMDYGGKSREEAEQSEKVLTAKRVLQDASDLSSLEDQVFSLLITFFSRYYQEGDFITKRRYSGPGKERYMIPYDGEEVKLVWANMDQYYIKSGENFSNFTFTLEGETPALNKRVHFRVKSADTEKDNRKAEEKRAFFLHRETPAEIDAAGDLVLYFEYRPATATDALSEDDEKALKTRFGAKNKGDLPGLRNAALALDAVAALGVEGEFFHTGLSALAPTEAVPQRPLIAKQLHRYVSGNTYDFFIHKDLHAFLSRELDYFLKSEVLAIEDMIDAPEERVRQTLRKAKAVRAIATQLITFLANLEDFQKKLWLKKKFVTAAHYCLTLDRLVLAAEADLPWFTAQIAANDAQIAAWIQLGFLAADQADALKTWLCQLTPQSAADFSLAPAPFTLHMMLDTAFYDYDFKARLLEKIPDLDAQCNGLLVHSENFQALNLLQERYRESVKCIYIDPPYNTGSDGFIYKDCFQHSSWISMIYDRIRQGRWFAKNDAAIFASIDEIEQPNFRKLFDSTWGEENYISDMVWAAGRKNDSRLISVSHEYMIVYANNKSILTESKVEWRQRKKGLDDIYAQHKKLKKEHGENYEAMTVGLKSWFKDLPDAHPAKAHKHYSQIDKNGVYFPADISWPGGGGPIYPVQHPVTKKDVRIPKRGWMTPDEDKMKQWIKDDLVHFGPDENSVPCIKSYLKDREFQAPYSVFYQDGRAATKRLRNVFGFDDFGYPKDEEVLGETFGMFCKQNESILDYFAGSGTTGHAVINLNREDGGNRKYILVEMGEHFDTVLKPRIQKVVYSADWKDGAPTAPTTGISHCFKYLRLESYEDTLNNLETKRTKEQQQALDAHPQLRDEYLLGYFLAPETQDSASLLRLSAFRDPWAYKLHVSTSSVGEMQQQSIDLIETFHYLIGLEVSHISRRFTKRLDKAPSRDANGKWQLSRFQSASYGEASTWSFQFIQGTTRAGEKTLILWRTLSGDLELDNAVLEAFLRVQDESPTRHDWDVIYVNGDSNLENLATQDADSDADSPAPLFKVRLIEKEFKQRMFAATE
jgi:adenine-specific DNA-methyltransferase